MASQNLALVEPEVKTLTKFDPEFAREQRAILEAGIEYAAKVKRWDLLDDAVDQMIGLQEQLVAWWDSFVSVNRGAGRGNKKISDQKSFSAEQARGITGITPVQVTRWRKRLAKPDAYHDQIVDRARRAAMAEEKEGQNVQQSMSNEHYTPAKYIESARKVMGGIDLDPASCPEANEVVKATRFYSRKDDGLGQSWPGRVWLNPPYGRIVGSFIGKLSEELASGSTTEAVVLVNAHGTDTFWFQFLWNGTLCFTDHRINFYGDDERSGSTHGSVFAYFGENDNAFAEEFSQYGAVVRSIQWET